MVMNLNLINNIKNFLYDKDYFISVFDSNIHLYGYEKITKFNESELEFKFKDFYLNIKGEKFLIRKMLSNEILISGIVKNFNKIYEESNMD